MVDSTGQPSKGIKEQFAARKARQWLVLIGFIPALLLAPTAKSGNVFGLDYETLQVWAPVGVLVALVFSSWNWRCPACKGSPGIALSPRFCAKCGVALK